MPEYYKIYPSKNHKILGRIKNSFLEMDADEDALTLLANNTAFIYPKTISFSVAGYRADVFEKPLDADSVSYDRIVMSLEGERPEVIEFRNITVFFTLLFKSFCKLNFSPLLIIDLRNSSTIDNSALLDILEISKSLNFQNRIILFGPDYIRPIIEAHIPLANYSHLHLIHSDQELQDFYYRYETQEERVLKIRLAGNLTPSSLENILADSIEGIIEDKFLVILELSELNNISFFSLNILNLFIHTLAHEYGVIFNINFENSSRITREKLLDFRTLKANNVFLQSDVSNYPTLKKDMNRFGVYLFSPSVLKETWGLFETFLGDLRLTYTDYLSQYATVNYEYKDRSYKPTVYRFQYHNIISSIIYELVGNAIEHSEGVGYLCLSVIRDLLFIFIGDSGVGLTQGILKNYALDDEITNDERSLEYLFNLADYKSRRRPKFTFDMGAGEGLRDTLLNISALKGKFIVRLSNKIASFMKPVVKERVVPSKIITSKINIIGTQYMIIIPLSQNSLSLTTEEFLTLEY